MSIKQAILKHNKGKEIDFKDYQNLILDEQPIVCISYEDKCFLEQFSECQLLSLISCNLKSMDMLPEIQTLEELDLQEN